MTEAEQIAAFLAAGKVEVLAEGASAAAELAERERYEASERAAEQRAERAFETRLRRGGRVA